MNGALVALPREGGKGPANRARRSGYVPAVLYGKDVTPLLLQVSAEGLKRLLKGGGQRRLIELWVAGEERPRRVILRELQEDERRGVILHIDFQQVNQAQRIKARVPVVLQGEDEVTRRGLVLEYQLREVEVEGLPGQLPEAITFEATDLPAGGVVLVSSLTAPPGCRIVSEPTQVVARLEIPRIIMEPTPLAEDVPLAEG